MALRYLILNLFARANPGIGLQALRDVMAVADTGTLRDWKCCRVGPPYIQLSARCVRYLESDILKFISDRRVVPSPRQVGRFSHRATL
jgi:hypothetical protein